MKGRRDWRNGCVTRAQPVANNVRLIEFAVEGALPPFDPGSHTDLIVDIGGAAAIRSYTCLPAPAGRVRVAVKLHEKSRGGSRYMWSLIEGAKVRLTVPENRFELSWRAPSYLLVAGGIGITPIYGMARALALRGVPVRLAYGGRSIGDMPFAAELAELLGERAALFDGQAKARIDLEREIANLPEGGEIYVCGPLSMLEEARAHWRTSGRPVSRFRCEVFGDSGRLPETAFTVAVANSNVRVDVRPDQSMLHALVDAGVDMIYDCERGECGLCAVDIVDAEGEIDHRDVFFSDEQRREARKMCTCVSRIAGGSVMIDTGYRA